jgi:phosphomannomutase
MLVLKPLEPEFARLSRELVTVHGLSGRWPDPFSPAIACRIAANMAVWLRCRQATRLLIGHDGRSTSLALLETMRPFFGNLGFTLFEGGLMATPAAALGMASCQAQAALVFAAGHHPLGHAGLTLLTSGEPCSASVMRRFLTDEPITAPASWTRPFFARSVAADPIWHLATGAPRFRHGFVFDALNGPAGPLLAGLSALQHRPIRLLHAQPMADYGGRDPDPASAANKAMLAQHLRETRARLGFAFDGDATGCLVMDSEGREIEPDLIACLFMRLDPAAMRSGIVVDPEANAVVEQVAQELGIPCIRAPSGQGHRLMAVKQGAALGIEMNRHYSFRAARRHDDGPFAALRIAELCDRDPGRFAQEVEDLRRRQRLLQEYRLPFSAIGRDAILKAMRARAAETGLACEQPDGVRITTGRGHFLLRASPTEDVLSVRFEGLDETVMATSGTLLRYLVDGLVQPGWEPLRG